MTLADLPPPTGRHGGTYESAPFSFYTESDVKRAVRKALERAKEAMYEQGADDRAKCAAIVRAMLEALDK